MILEKKSYLPGIMLFIISVIISLCSYKDYGVSWDEPTQREIGYASYDYAFNHDNKLDTYVERDHGVGFELPLIIAERLFNLSNTRDVYLMRHLLTNLFFLISGLCCYFLALRLFKNNFLACLGFIIFVFQPRIYAHSYFNTKDIPFLCMFMVSLLACQVAFEKNKIVWYLLLGLACGYTTSIRILSIILIIIICFFFIIDIITAVVKKEKIGLSIINLLVFLAGTCAMLYIAFPTLWHSPVDSFLQTFRSLSHFRWGGNVLLDGKMVSSEHLPWTYIPIWFCITNPLIWLLSGLVAVLLVAINFFKRPLIYLTNTPERNYILYAACFILPVVAVIALNSIVYDDWRHLYFIYAPFVLLVLYTINKLYTSRAKGFIILVCIIQLIGVGSFMIKNHPFQQVYFNKLVSHKDEYLRKNYELDYWGAAYLQGLEYIAAHDTASVINVLGIGALVENNISMLPADVRKRFVIPEDNSKADYYITNFRGHPDDFNYPSVFFNIKVLNSSILTVYKVH